MAAVVFVLVKLVRAARDQNIRNVLRDLANAVAKELFPATWLPLSGCPISAGHNGNGGQSKRCGLSWNLPGATTIHFRWPTLATRPSGPSASPAGDQDVRLGCRCPVPKGRGPLYQGAWHSPDLCLAPYHARRASESSRANPAA